MAESDKPPRVSSLRRWNGYASNHGRRRNKAHFSPFNGRFTSYTRRSGFMLRLTRGWRYFFRATTEGRLVDAARQALHIVHNTPHGRASVKCPPLATLPGRTFPASAPCGLAPRTGGK